MWQGGRGERDEGEKGGRETGRVGRCAGWEEAKGKKREGDHSLTFNI